MNNDDYKNFVEGYAIKNISMKLGVFSFHLEEDTDHSEGDGTIHGRLIIYGLNKPDDEKWFKINTTNMDNIHAAWSVIPDSRIISVTFHGGVWTTGAGQNDDADTLHNTYETPSFSNVRCVANGKVYAVGGNRSVFRRDAHEQWVRLGNGLYYRTRENKQGYNQKGEVAPRFKDIAGFSDNDLYVCGEGGELYHYNGTEWRSLEPPTNRDFWSVCCAGDGYVYVVGMQGMILRGRDDLWEILEQGIDNSGFLAVRWFKDKVYISSWYGLYTLQGDELQRVDVLPAILNDYGHLDANEDYLLVAGPYTAASYDGTKWRNLINEGLDLDQHMDDLQDMQILKAQIENKKSK